MLFRPQGLLGMKELSFVKTWDNFRIFLKNPAKFKVIKDKFTSNKGEKDAK